jgi:hypothetical protein
MCDEWKGNGVCRGDAGEKLAPRLRSGRKQGFRIETPAGFNHGRKFSDADISQLAYPRRIVKNKLETKCSPGWRLSRKALQYAAAIERKAICG